MGIIVEGFYAVYYTGIAGFGHAVLVINDGIVTGADATGGVYDGTYKVSASGSFSIEVVLTVPAGTTLVTGQTLPDALRQTIIADLNASFANGQPVPLQTQLGPVNVIFKKLRGM
ncbi:hypothetical protein [Rhodovulum strictum]|uniref:Uncharacterized protein n=1 Tax=Rhodovulum strictum TaxID=58314 RepID=A0A844BJT4_9RHOB|nr:hypothetical protein [Rhodovulum strictum]MRH21845.1 hypothetical protein [Rhodovulum strictum]